MMHLTCLGESLRVYRAVFELSPCSFWLIPLNTLVSFFHDSVLGFPDFSNVLPSYPRREIPTFSMS